MNDIKYRVRFKPDQKMFDVAALIRTSSPEELRVFPKTTITLEWEVLNRAVESWNIILMQSTWLFDKNGKEIYEGDIIGNWFYDDDRTMVVEKDEDFSGFNISYRLQECIIDTDTREVIGNIYKDPDLVKQ